MESAGTVRQGNIDQAGQNRRIRMSIILLSLTLAAALFLTQADFPRWTRALLFFPFLGVAIGSFSGLHQVCYSAAFRGVRVVGGCQRKLVEPDEVERLQREARLVMFESIAGAALGATLLLLLP